QPDRRRQGPRYKSKESCLVSYSYIRKNLSRERGQRTQRNSSAACSCSRRPAPGWPPSTALDVQRQDLARLGLNENFNWPATNFAIGGEALRGDACVDDQLEGLATERTTDRGRNLHYQRLRAATSEFTKAEPERSEF